MYNSQVFIHIGYPKTGTTTLQTNLFPYHNEITNLRSKRENITFFDDLIFGRENSFKRTLPKIKTELAEILTEAETNKIVYSEESLTSFSMFFRFRPAPYIWTVDPNSVARKIGVAFKDSQVFRSCKVIITIRRQDEIIKSMYAQVYNLVFKRFRYTKTFSRFVDYSIKNNSSGFILDAIDYDAVVSKYENIFGIDNVCVLVFEQLQTEPDRYIEKLCSFMQIDPVSAKKLMKEKALNKRSSPEKYRTDERNLIEILAYYKARFFPNLNVGLRKSFIFNVFKKIYIPGRYIRKLKFTERQASFLKDRFSAGNVSLSKRHDLQLERYGYSFEG